MITGLVIALFFILMFAALLIPEPPSEAAQREHCCDWHRRNGTHQVFYPDCNGFSQPFTLAVANDYAGLFNGVVVPYGFEHDNNPHSKRGREKVEKERAQREKEEWA